MKKLILAALLLPLFSVAQKTGDNLGTKEATVESKDGMKFEHGLSWAQIQAKAKAENKYIIMDCFTTWCGPCKFMDKEIFPLKESGDFFNEKFINVKVQFDSTANDNEEVKSWKKDMKEIEKQYGIAAYPTYLMFDPNGVVVHRAVGSTVKASEFIARGKESLVPETQYYTQLRKYQENKKEGDAKKMAVWAQKTYDLKNAALISEEYIAGLTDVFTKDNLEFIDKFTTKSKDKGFTVMLENMDKVDAVLGKGKAEQKIKNIIYAEDVFPTVRAALTKKDDNTAPDFAALVEKVSKKYPAYAGELTGKAKLVYYQNKKDWANYQTTVVAYMDKYGDKATPAELNTYAWAVFDNCKDMTCVAQALEWSKRSITAENPSPGYMDTYANILHKVGRTKEAIEIQEKALAIMNADARYTEESKKTYLATLEKMKKGEKTWTEE